MMKLSACLCHISPYCLYLCVSACHLQAQSFHCKSNYILIAKLSNDWTSEGSSMLEVFFYYSITSINDANYNNTTVLTTEIQIYIVIPAVPS